jgi:hypothetical protein
MNLTLEMGFKVDNTLKVLLGVLGFAGVVTFLTTMLNTPDTPKPTPISADSKPTAAPQPPVPGEENADENTVVVDDEDVTKEELDSFGDPSVELPGDEEEEQTPTFDGPQSDDSNNPAEGPPPPPPPGVSSQ